MKYFIYTLTDPIDNNVKYIGKTKNLKDRLWRHTSPYSLKDSWTPKNKWLLYLKKEGYKPIIEVLDEGNENNIDDLEIYWISQFKTWGFKLKNSVSGGKGADYWKGKKLSAEHAWNTKMNNPRRKDISEYEIGTNKLLTEYITLKDASSTTGHKTITISNSCKGITSSDKFGVYWRYKDNYFPYEKKIIKQSEESKLKSKMNNPLRKIICQYEIGTDKLINEFLSGHDVEKYTGCLRGHVLKCCKGIKNFNTAGGYYWRYKDNYFPLVLSVQEHWNPSKNKKNK